MIETKLYFHASNLKNIIYFPPTPKKKLKNIIEHIQLLSELNNGTTLYWFLVVQNN